MLLSIASTLYELIIGENANNPEYRDGIFGSVGILTFTIAIIFCLLFYVLFGRKWHIWYTRTHWVITLVLVAAIGFVFAMTQAKGQIGSVDSYVVRFALANALYAAIYFVVFSFLFKNFSVYSKRIPL